MDPYDFFSSFVAIEPCANELSIRPHSNFFFGQESLLITLLCSTPLTDYDLRCLRNSLPCLWYSARGEIRLLLTKQQDAGYAWLDQAGKLPPELENYPHERRPRNVPETRLQHVSVSFRRWHDRASGGLVP